LHTGARWLIKLDIHDFFDSIEERSVYPIFEGLGYPRLLSLEFTRLCTRAGPIESVRRKSGQYQGKAPYAVQFEGYLPQGAPTSGALANAVMIGVDSKLSAFARRQGLVYTRYSDDLTFSAGPRFSRRRAAGVVTRTAEVLERAGFALHRAKARVIPPGARHVILGVLVDDDRVRLLPDYKRRLEVHVRGVAKFGLAEHAHHRRFDSILSMINHVDGCIAFAASVDPVFAASLRNRWNAAIRDRGYAGLDAPTDPDRL
jgi:hypothetical protein